MTARNRIKGKLRRLGLFPLGLVALWSSVAMADAGKSGGGLLDVNRLIAGIVDSVIYTCLGIVLLIVAYKIFDMVTPFDVNKELSEDDNTAVGIFMAGVFIAVGMVIASAISG